MNLFRCCGSGSNGTNLIGLLKQSIHPEWKQGQPLPASVTSINELATCYTEPASSDSNIKLTYASTLMYDQFNFYYSDFTPEYITIELYDINRSRIRFLKDMPTIDNNGNITFTKQYSYSITNCELKTLQSRRNVTIPLLDTTITYKLTSAFNETSPKCVLFSTVDIVSPNGNYHIYKNINMNDYKLIYQT